MRLDNSHRTFERNEALERTSPAEVEHDHFSAMKQFVEAN